MKQRYKTTVEKISNLVKNDRPVDVPYIYTQKTMLLKVDTSAQGLGNIL